MLAARLAATPGMLSILSGVAGGVAMAGTGMVVSAWQGEGPWAPLRTVGGALESARMPFELGEGGRLAAGLVLHLVTAGFWGLRYGGAVRAFPILARDLRLALPAGLVWGAVVWLLMGLIVGPAFNPAVRQIQPLHFFASHLIWAVTCALTLVGLVRGLGSSVLPP